MGMENNPTKTNPTVTIVEVGNGGGWYHICKNGYVKAVARGLTQAKLKAQELENETPQQAKTPFEIYSTFISKGDN